MEAVILLDLVQTIYNKAYQIEQATINLAIDNEVVWKMIHGYMKVPNHYNQDVAAEAETIYRIIEQYQIRIQIDRVNSHKKITTTVQQDSGTHIVKYCHNRANEI